MIGDCGCGVCGDCNSVSAGIWVILTGSKSGYNLVTLFNIVKGLFPDVFLKNLQNNFPKMRGGGGRRPFGIRPIW